MKSLFTLFILVFALVLTSKAESVELGEKQIIRNADVNIYKTVRLMLHFTENKNTIAIEDMQNLISAFSADQKISSQERKILKFLETDIAQFAIESPYTKQLLIINKSIEPSASAHLNFFWDRMSGDRSDKDQIANYLYLRLPGRFFEYYYHNNQKSTEMATILDEYVNYLCQNSDKENWTFLKKELSRIYIQINLGNVEKENEYKMMVHESYKKAKENYDLPKMHLALGN